MGKIKFILKNITQEDLEFFNESEFFENTNHSRIPESIIVKDLKYDVIVTDQQTEIDKANDRHTAVIGLDREIEKEPQMRSEHSDELSDIICDENQISRYHSNAASDNACDEKQISIDNSYAVPDNACDKNTEPPASQPRISSRFIIGSLWALDQEFIRKVHDLTYRIPHVILETERTIIKQCDPERDILPLIEIYSKPHVNDYIEPLYPFAEETVYQRDYFDNIYALYDFGMWNVFLKENGRLIGRCGAEYMQPPIDIEKFTADNSKEINGQVQNTGKNETVSRQYTTNQEGLETSDNQWLELGYLIDSDYWHMGLGYETTKAVVEMALEHGHRQIFAEINQRNTASIALAKKLGFTYYDGNVWIFDAHNVLFHADSNVCR